MQVDWLSCYIRPRDPSYHGNRIWEPARYLRLSPDGELESEKPALTPVAGSHDNRMTWGSSTGNELYVSGNPVKFIQGHNLFGSDHYLALLASVGSQCRVNGSMPFPGIATWQRYDFVTTPTRLDITRSYRFSDQTQAEQWLTAVAAVAHASRLKKDTRHTGTVYFGLHSRRWSMKIYLKHPEILSRSKQHRLSESLSRKDRRRLVEWSEGVVRFELTLRSLELQRHNYAQLQPSNLLQLWQLYYDRIQFNRNYEAIAMADATEIDLPRRARGILTSWRAGVSIKDIETHATFYRYRRIILDQVGVDISEPPTQDTAEAVASLLPEGWDPDPIDKLMHDPLPAGKQYGLMPRQ